MGSKVNLPSSLNAEFFYVKCCDTRTATLYVYVILNTHKNTREILNCSLPSSPKMRCIPLVICTCENNTRDKV